MGTASKIPRLQVVPEGAGPCQAIGDPGLGLSSIAAHTSTLAMGQGSGGAGPLSGRRALSRAWVDGQCGWAETSPASNAPRSPSAAPSSVPSPGPTRDPDPGPAGALLPPLQSPAGPSRDDRTLAAIEHYADARGSATGHAPVSPSARRNGTTPGTPSSVRVPGSSNESAWSVSTTRAAARRHGHDPFGHDLRSRSLGSRQIRVEAVEDLVGGLGPGEGAWVVGPRAGCQRPVSAGFLQGVHGRSVVRAGGRCVSWLFLHGS